VKILFKLFFVIVCFSSCVEVRAQTLEKTIPITINNLKGHKALFDEGYYVITSSRKALDYAYAQSVVNTRQVWSEIFKIRDERNSNYDKNKIENIRNREIKSKNIKNEIVESGDRILKNTEAVTDQLNTKAIASRKEAFEALTLGYIQFGKRTEKDVRELKEIKASWFSDLKNDYQNFGQIYDEVSQKEQTESIGFIKKAFLNANEEIQREYKTSGERSNSLVALKDLSWGYLKGLYFGVFKPAGEGVASSAILTYNVISKTVESSAKVFFYTSSIGYKIIAPSIESGYLGSLSLVQWASARTVSVGGRGIYLINQAAVVGSEPVYKSGQWMLSTVTDTAENSVLTVFDYGQGVGQVALNQVKAGVVLGVNAITALPAQAVLVAANSVVFLTYDGPRLVVYAARGKIKGVNADEIPVGVVVDMGQLKKQGIKLEKISDEPKDIESVIHESSKDLIR